MSGPILLLGRCGLERLAAPLRERVDVEVVVAGWTQVELAARLAPSLVYVDLFDWDVVGPLTTAALVGRAPQPDVGPLRAVVSALEGAPVVYRGARRPSAGAFGLLERRPGLDAALDALTAVVDGQRVLDVAGLWARHGVVLDDVAFGMGHGEAGAEGAALEARWVEALWWARTRGPVKCVVVDLDDTLIHGRVAEDTFHDLNPAYLPEGEAARRPLLEGWWRLRRGLHEALRIVASRGVVIALATRNDPRVVAARWRKRPPEPDREPGLYAFMYDDLPEALREAAFARHPRLLHDLALGPQDMVHIEAGLGAKSQMCRRIAERLGVGLEALALLDDAAFEREEVRAHAPEVWVMDGPVEGFREQLLHGPRFTTWAVTGAARARPASYRSRAAVSDVASRSDPDALEAFLRDLAIEVTVRVMEEAERGRVEELLQRTHQLNLTGRRPALDGAACVLVATCRDRIADHGLIAAGVFSDARLEAWVCSCRVLPHRVAATILGEMLRRAPGAEAWRAPTPRNGATLGLIEEARCGPAPWVRLRPAVEL